MRRTWSMRLVMLGVALLLSAQTCGGSDGGGGGAAAAGGNPGVGGVDGAAGAAGAAGEDGPGGRGGDPGAGGHGGDPGAGGHGGQAGAAGGDGRTGAGGEAGNTGAAGGPGDCFDGGPILADVVDVDCNAYDTVVIGEQRWFQTNLKTTRYRDGTPIPTGLSNAAWTAADEGAYAIYDDDPVNDQLYGKLYNWHAVNDPAGLCPDGWRVPTPGDMTQLRLFIGFEANDGGKMKSTTGWNAPNTGATNSSGFDAKPGGQRAFTNGEFGGEGERAAFWTSVASANGGFVTFAFHFSFFFMTDEFIDGARSQESGFSVRCIEE